MYRGFTKAYRKELNSQIWLMPPVYHRVWFILRQKVKYISCIFPTRKGYGIHLNPGQLITSFDQISQWAAWTEWGKEKKPNKKTIKAVIDWLKANKMIAVESNTSGTYINITNWDIYQHEDAEKVTKRKRLADTVKEEFNKGKNKKLLKKSIKRKFIKPSLEEINQYCLERKNDVDSEKWLSYYESNGWKVGKNSMKDWKAAIRTWEKNNFGNGKKSNQKYQPRTLADQRELENDEIAKRLNLEYEKNNPSPNQSGHGLLED